MTSISLNVTHAPWIPERVATLRTLRERLGVTNPKLSYDDVAEDDRNIADLIAETITNDMAKHFSATPGGPYAEETTRSSAWVWQSLQLEWSLAQHAQWHFFAQDDDIVPPGVKFFWSTLRAICDGCGYDVVCLHNGHPAARALFVGGATGYTTADGLVGQFFGAKHEVIARYDAWRRDAIHDAITQKMIASNGVLGEDTLFGMFCMHEGLRIFHPLPTLYDHDTSIASTNDGYDGHLYRAPQVCWYDAHRAQHEIRWADPAWWGSKVVHLGRFYEASHTMLSAVLRDKTRAAELVEQYRADVCPKAYHRFFHRVNG